MVTIALVSRFSASRLIPTSFHIISVLQQAFGREGFTFYVKAVGFIYLMSTNLFISLKKKNLREIIEEFYCLFSFKIRIGLPFSSITPS